MHAAVQVLFVFITPAMIMGCNASDTSAPMLARSLLTYHRMHVDLLTNALVSNVGVVSGLSESAAPTNARSSDLEENGRLTTTNEVQRLTPDNTPIDVSGQSVHEEPAKDFEQTLAEQTQAETQPDQAQPVSAEPSLDLAAGSDETVQEAANMPQQEVGVDNSQGLAQLLESTGLSGLVDTNAAGANLAGVKSTPTIPESTNAIIELTGQVESKAVQLSEDNAASVLNAQPAEGEQIEAETTPNGALVSQEGAATEGKNAELVSESFASGDTTVLSGGKLDDAVVQATVNAEPASQEKSDMLAEASRDTQPPPDEHGPKMSVGDLGESGADVSADQQANTLSESLDGDGMQSAPAEKTLAGDSFIQELNAAQVEPATSQAKGRNTPTLDGKESTESEQMIPVDTPQISAAEQPLAAAQTSKSVANPSDGDTSSTVGEQIRESITSSTVGLGREITIRLNPPELGSVVVKFREQGDQITGLLEVSKSQTRAEIQQALPEITRDLQELGVQVKRLEVVMTGEQDHQALNGQSGMPHQESWGGQQGASNSDPYAPDASGNELSADNSAYTGFRGSTQTYVTDRSIDMFA